jgi:peptidyl-prolyl cis-trans isomerase D
MDPAFEAAAFALQEGEVSEPVRSNFGYHLIKLTGIQPSSVKPFDEVRDEVEQAYRKAEGERLYFEMAEQLADLSYEDPSSLLPAASTLKLKVETSDWVSRNRAQGVLASPKVLAAAFSDDVLLERNNSELIEIDQEQAIVLRVIEYMESSIQPLPEVSETIVENLHQQHAIDQARAEAEKRLASLQAGTDIVEIAEQTEFKRKTSLTRNDMSVPPTLVREIFRLPHPVDGSSVSGMIQLATGDFAVYNLYAVNDVPADKISATLKNQLKNNLRQRLGRAQYGHLVADLEARADISYLKSDEEE